MTHARRALLAVAIALLSALFFTATYVLNRAAAVDGGHWAWTAALRYLCTLPLLLLSMPWLGGIAPVWKAVRAAPGAWLLWSGVGFVLFYVLLSYAAASGPSWLIAGSFQVTVVAGPCGASAKTTSLCASKGLRKSSLSATRPGAAASTIRMLPSPTFLSPDQA